MKKFKTTIFLLSILFCSLCSSQAFQTVSATRQPWSGGVVGRHGIYYKLELETKLKSALPDTIWINNVYYPLDFSGKNIGYKRVVDSAKHLIVYYISVSESHFDPTRNSPLVKKDTAASAPMHIRHFEGAAMLSYRQKRKQHFFIVKSFTELKTLNYP